MPSPVSKAWWFKDLKYILAVAARWAMWESLFLQLPSAILSASFPACVLLSELNPISRRRVLWLTIAERHGTLKMLCLCISGNSRLTLAGDCAPNIMLVECTHASIFEIARDRG